MILHGLGTLAMYAMPSNFEVRLWGLMISKFLNPLLTTRYWNSGEVFKLAKRGRSSMRWLSGPSTCVADVCV